MRRRLRSHFSILPRRRSTRGRARRSPLQRRSNGERGRVGGRRGVVAVVRLHVETRHRVSARSGLRGFEGRPDRPLSRSAHRRVPRRNALRDCGRTWRACHGSDPVPPSTHAEPRTATARQASLASTSSSSARTATCARCSPQSCVLSSMLASTSREIRCASFRAASVPSSASSARLAGHPCSRG